MIQKFNSFNANDNVHVTELEFNKGNMLTTSNIFNLLKNLIQDGEKLSDTIKNTLSVSTYDKLFKRYSDRIKSKFDLLNFFMTSSINKDYLLHMFSNVAIQKGSDWEDEWVATLEINEKTVLLLASPERGMSIRVQHDENYSMPFDELNAIIKTLCDIYNERL